MFLMLPDLRSSDELLTWLRKAGFDCYAGDELHLLLRGWGCEPLPEREDRLLDGGRLLVRAVAAKKYRCRRGELVVVEERALKTSSARWWAKWLEG